VITGSSAGDLATMRGMPMFRRRRGETPATPDQVTRAGSAQARPPLVPADLAPGTEVAGYRVDGVLGRGGMGVVYRAEHVHLGRQVALKLLAPGLGGDRSFRERFVRESRMAASLDHPNVVTVFDAGEADGLLYIAMQSIKGIDLGARLRDDGALPLADVAAVADQVGSALDAAHTAGLVHRDVKPANILLQNGHCFLTDFGLTKRLASTTALTVQTDIVGTPDYLAPEQIDGTKIDGRSDQYALGCVLYHCLSGSAPFEGDSDIAVIQAHLSEDAADLTKLRTEIPPAVDDVLRRAMAKDPAERYPTMSDMSADLQSALGIASRSPKPRIPVGSVIVGVADHGTRAVIRAAIGRGPVELVDVEDTQGLLALAAASQPSLILLEIGLPGDPATYVCRRLRSSGGAASTPVIALAERGRDEQWRAALEAGADDVLLRPFSAFQLMAKVRDHVPQALER
jgi:serine/threonine-protein kinase